jgi:hypothetical protein
MVRSHDWRTPSKRAPIHVASKTVIKVLSTATTILIVSPTCLAN